MARVAVLVSAAVLALAASGARSGAGPALPPAGSDLLPLLATVDLLTPLGPERMVLTGWGRLDRDEPLLEAGAGVVDLELVELHLRGATQLGVVTLAESPDAASTGELRSLGPGATFPASSSVDLLFVLAFPDSPFGPLGFRNEAAVRLVPREAGVEVALEGWPPLGVAYARDPAGGDECLPLAPDEANPEGIALCLEDVALTVAPQWPSYSVAPGGPSPLHPAALYALTPVDEGAGPLPPFLRIACPDLGLTAAGCADVTPDDLDALSFGDDLPLGGRRGAGFSVAPGALGVEGSAVAAQAACPPADPGLSPEPQSDEFHSDLDGGNELLLDGNGPVGACVTAFPLGLVEGLGAHDDLDALHARDSSTVDPDADGVPELPLYFSLAAGSPSLAALGLSPADVLVTSGGAPPVAYATAAALGLAPGDDIDALCLREDGDGAFGAGDELVFSLAPGSPSLVTANAGPGDLLAPGSPPAVLVRANALGLRPSDDLNAATCEALDEDGDGDVDCDGFTTALDAALLLHLEAALIDAVPCPRDADVDRDGLVNSVDAALVLQLVAGLIERLPINAQG